MSGPSQEDPRRPLLQTVCHAGFLTLAAVMADQAHQLPHLGLNSLSSLALRQPPVRITNKKSLYTEPEGGVSGGIKETKEYMEAQTDPRSSRLLPDKEVKVQEDGESQTTTASTRLLPDTDDEVQQDTERKTDAGSSRFLPDGEDKEKEEERDLPIMELPCAPIYSFDEDGDILQCVEAANLSDANRNLPRGEETLKATQGSLTEKNRSSTDSAAPERPSEAPGVQETEGSPVTSCTTEDTRLHTTAREESKEPTPCQENRVTEEEDARTCSHPILASVGAAEETVPHIDVAERSDIHDKDDSHDTSAMTLPEVRVVSEALKVTPKINLHASSVEVEDDYLESHLEDDHLRDLCASLMAECGWQSRAPPTQGSVMGLLSVAPHDPGTRRTPKVPFDAVVFTERKPSTGDALVLSLGLSADGANSIQDIASRNQGAARERLQQGEVLPAEVKLTRQCESCGVSPEECLKKLGLHTEVVRPVASPKSERLLHFFKHIPVDIQSRVAAAAAAAAAATPLSDHEFEQAITSSKQKSRSLSSSPTNAEDDGRKSRLVAL